MRKAESPRDSALEDDVQFLTELDREGLIAFSRAVGDNRFDVIARLAADTVDMNGATGSNRGFFFEVHYPRRYPDHRPRLQWPGSAPIPRGDIFRPAPLSLRRLVSWPRLDFRHHVSTGSLQLGVHGVSVADLVMLTCFGINPFETNDVLSRMNLSSHRLSLLDMAAQSWFQYGSVKELLRKPAPPGRPLPDIVPREQAVPKPTFRIKHVERSLTVRDRRYPPLRRIIGGEEQPGLPLAFITEDAWTKVITHIAWGKKTSKNVVEQGGWLIGRVFRDPVDEATYSIITHCLPARETAGSSVYVEFGYQHWNTMFNELDGMKEQGRIAAESVVTGWYHTHPNSLDVFMSGTDVNTQRTLYKDSWNIALVLNPHRQLCAAFCGADALRTNLFMTDDLLSLS